MEHPIEGLMRTALENLKSMVEVNTVVGDPVETPAGMVIIPVSRVACGFAAGGSAFAPEHSPPKLDGEMPFGGGSGAGVSVQPVGFLVVNGDQVRLLSVEGNQLAERLVDLAPQLLEKLGNMRRRDQGVEVEITPG
ncbi:GerW family sporulation protein [Desulfothermobacter acidiphilus]|uniref:GerW family sporulation protein n=1 Tax=Desulfothermobacter acidiphilus TaxID=1938353 RepID=UPI003F8CAC65